MSGETPDPAFGSLIFQHCDALYNYARQLCYKRTDAEDLVQDTYVRAVRARHRFTPGTNEKAWLFRIIHNRFMEKARRTKLERAYIQSLPDHDDDCPDESLGFAFCNIGSTEEQTVRSFDVRQALHTMPRDLRTVLVLRYMEGLTCDEIAVILGIPSGTVFSRSKSARTMLRKKLAGYQAGGDGYMSNG